MTSPQVPNLPSGWVVVADRQDVLDRIGQVDTESLQLGGVEIRLDLWQGRDPELSRVAGLSVLVTDRGGIDSVPRTDRRNQLCRVHGGLLDVDPRTDAPAPERQPWIYSSHRSSSTDCSVEQQIEEARQLGAVAVKIVLADASPENLQIARQLPLQSPDLPVVCFCAGVEGTADRIRALESGQPWGYARLGQHPDQISGLPSIESLCR